MVRAFHDRKSGLLDCGAGNVVQDITISAQGHVTSAGSTNLDNRYYTENELDAGQLDNRYFTETELSGGQLNNLYYTETELDGGQLDNRYFTETELNNGALDPLRTYPDGMDVAVFSIDI